MRICLLATLACALLSAQDKPKLVDFRVDVVDSFSGRGVPAAEVMVMSGSDGPIRKSDARGSATFSVFAGKEALVRVVAKGFVTILRRVPVGNESQSFTATIESLSQIRGTLLDRDTGLPVANVGIRAVPVIWIRGRRNGGMHGGQVQTDKEGRFVLPDVSPGDVVLEFQPLVLKPGKGSEPDLGYARRVWPGGGGLDDASPLRVTPGGDQQVGKIELKQQPLYRVGVTPVGDKCGSLTFQVGIPLITRNSVWGLAPDLPARCGTRVEFSGLSAGTYPVEISFDVERELLGYQSVTVSGKNADVRVEVRDPVPFRGYASVEGEDEPFKERLSLGIWPEPDDPHLLISRLARPPVQPDSSGVFSGKVFLPPSGRLRFHASPLPDGLFIKEVKINGRVSNSATGEVDPFAKSLDIHVVFSKESGSIEGSIKECKCTARVFLIPYPMMAVDQYPLGSMSVETADGHFRFTRLRPGTYRVVAVTPTDDDRLDRPGVLLGLASSSRNVELSSGAPTNIEVPLSVY